ncbi:hypothetical protein [Clostridium sp.]|uniref:hypothetical protein n=1 Tax=Clostridium sp. TaxID=1506 RepID=UPI002FDE0DD2
MFCKIRKKHILLISTLVVVVVVGFVSFNNLKQNIKKTSSINVNTQELSETNSKDTQLSDTNNNHENSEVISRHYIYQKDQVPYVILLDQ